MEVTPLNPTTYKIEQKILRTKLSFGPAALRLLHCIVLAKLRQERVSKVERVEHTLTFSHSHILWSGLVSHSHTLTFSHSHILTCSPSHILTYSESQNLTLSHSHTLTMPHFHILTLSHSHNLHTLKKAHRLPFLGEPIIFSSSSSSSSSSSNSNQFWC